MSTHDWLIVISSGLLAGLSHMVGYRRGFRYGVRQGWTDCQKSGCRSRFPDPSVYIPPVRVVTVDQSGRVIRSEAVPQELKADGTFCCADPLGESFCGQGNCPKKKGDA